MALAATAAPALALEASRCACVRERRLSLLARGTKLRERDVRVDLEPVLPLQKRNTAHAERSKVIPKVANSTPLAPPRNIRTSVKVHRWGGVANRSATGWRFLITMCKAIVSALELGDLRPGLLLSLFVKAVDVEADGLVAHRT